MLRLDPKETRSTVTEMVDLAGYIAALARVTAVIYRLDGERLVGRDDFASWSDVSRIFELIDRFAEDIVTIGDGHGLDGDDVAQWHAARRLDPFTSIARR